jgi:hypothetical protein
MNHGPHNKRMDWLAIVGQTEGGDEHHPTSLPFNTRWHDVSQPHCHCVAHYEWPFRLVLSTTEHYGTTKYTHVLAPRSNFQDGKMEIATRGLGCGALTKNLPPLNCRWREQKVSASGSGTNIPLSFLFSNTPYLWSSLTIRNQNKFLYQYHCRSWTTVTMLRHGRRRNRCSIPARSSFFFLLLSTASSSCPRRPCGPLKPIQWEQGPFSPGIKRPECEAEHSSQASTEVKNEFSHTLTSPKSS